MPAPRITQTPDLIEYVPRFEKQLAARAFPEQTKLLFIGGVGFGKTLTMADFVLEECFNYPLGQMMVAGATIPAMKLATIVKLLESFRAMNVWYNYIEYKQEVHFSNGTWFKFQSLDVPTKELEGSELHALAVDEITACPRAQVFSLLNRVRRQSSVASAWNKALKFNLPTLGLTRPGDADWWDYSRRVLFCGNPPEAGHWLEEAFIPTDEDTPPIGEYIQASTYENKLLPDDYIAGLEKQYPPGSFMHKRMMLGLFGIPAEGAIYDVFDPAVHIIERDRLRDEDVALWIQSIDLGAGGQGGDPFVWLQAALTKDQRVVITHEYYNRAGALLADHAAYIRAHAKHGVTFCDYGAQQRMELRALGIRTRPANKDLLMGIHAVRARLANHQLFLVRDAAPMLLRELPFYTWQPGDKPHAANGDHALDCMRYIISGIDLPRSE